MEWPRWVFDLGVLLMLVSIMLGQWRIEKRLDEMIDGHPDEEELT